MAYDLTIFGDTHCVIDNRCRLSCDVDLDTELSGAELGFVEPLAIVNLLKLWDYDPVLVAALIAPARAALQLCLDAIADILPIVHKWAPSDPPRVEDALVFGQDMLEERAEIVREKYKTGSYFEPKFPHEGGYAMRVASPPGRRLQPRVEHAVGNAVLNMVNLAKTVYMNSRRGNPRYADPKMLEDLSVKRRAAACARWCRAAAELVGEDTEEQQCWQTNRLLELALAGQRTYPFAFNVPVWPRDYELLEIGITSFECEGVLSWR
jgi:hypothetical protein